MNPWSALLNGGMLAQGEGGGNDAKWQSGSDEKGTIRQERRLVSYIEVRYTI